MPDQDWTPGDYERAYTALRDLAEALGTMQMPDPVWADQDRSIGDMFTSVLGTIASSVAHHQRVVYLQEATRPAGGLLLPNGTFVPGTFDDDGEFRPLG